MTDEPDGRKRIEFRNIVDEALRDLISCLREREQRHTHDTNGIEETFFNECLCEALVVTAPVIFIEFVPGRWSLQGGVVG